MDDLLNWGYELFKRSISFAIPTTSFRTVITGDKSEGLKVDPQPSEGDPTSVAEQESKDANIEDISQRAGVATLSDTRHQLDRSASAVRCALDDDDGGSFYSALASLDDDFKAKCSFGIEISDWGDDHTMVTDDCVSSRSEDTLYSPKSPSIDAQRIDDNLKASSHSVDPNATLVHDSEPNIPPATTSASSIDPVSESSGSAFQPPQQQPIPRQFHSPSLLASPLTLPQLHRFNVIVDVLEQRHAGVTVAELQVLLHPNWSADAFPALLDIAAALGLVLLRPPLVVPAPFGPLIHLLRKLHKVYAMKPRLPLTLVGDALASRHPDLLRTQSFSEHMRDAQYAGLVSVEGGFVELRIPPSVDDGSDVHPHEPGSTGSPLSPPSLLPITQDLGPGNVHPPPRSPTPDGSSQPLVDPQSPSHITTTTSSTLDALPHPWKFKPLLGYLEEKLSAGAPQVSLFDAVMFLNTLQPCPFADQSPARFIDQGVQLGLLARGQEGATKWVALAGPFPGTNMALFELQDFDRLVDLLEEHRAGIALSSLHQHLQSAWDADTFRAFVDDAIALQLAVQQTGGLSVEPTPYAPLLQVMRALEAQGRPDAQFSDVEDMVRGRFLRMREPDFLTYIHGARLAGIVDICGRRVKLCRQFRVYDSEACVARVRPTHPPCPVAPGHASEPGSPPIVEVMHAFAVRGVRIVAENVVAEQLRGQFPELDDGSEGWFARCVDEARDAGAICSVGSWLRLPRSGSSSPTSTSVPAVDANKGNALALQGSTSIPTSSAISTSLRPELASPRETVSPMASYARSGSPTSLSSHPRDTFSLGGTLIRRPSLFELTQHHVLVLLLERCRVGWNGFIELEDLGCIHGLIPKDGPLRIFVDRAVALGLAKFSAVGLLNMVKPSPYAPLVHTLLVLEAHGLGTVRQSWEVEMMVRGRYPTVLDHHQMVTGGTDIRQSITWEKYIKYAQRAGVVRVVGDLLERHCMLDLPPCHPELIRPHYAPAAFEPLIHTLCELAYLGRAPVTPVDLFLAIDCHPGSAPYVGRFIDYLRQASARNIITSSISGMVQLHPSFLEIDTT